jgi:myo-inositol-1(or 4)-monophosphatase
MPIWTRRVDPVLRESTHPVLAETCRAAASAAGDAWSRYDRTALASEVRIGADGTPTMLIDQLVEEAILAVTDRYRVNLLSEEVGFIDHGSAITLVVDPLDGSANAAAGVPLSCFSGVLLDDGDPVEALTCWLETGWTIGARHGEDVPYRTSGRAGLPGAALSMLRPKTGPRGDNTVTWTELAGGFVCDAFGRLPEFSTDLTLRYSGVVAATQALAEEVCAVIAHGKGASQASPIPR